MICTNRYTINANVIDVLKKIRKDSMWNGDIYLKDIVERDGFILVTCPFHKNHNESKPACGVFTQPYKSFKVGDFHCFACGERGSIVKLVSKCLNISYTGAEEWLYYTFGGESGVTIDLPRIELGREKNEVEEIDSRKLEQFDYYHPYTDKRGLSRKIVDEFRIGYDSVTDSITFPVWDERGKLKFITERSVKSKRFNIPRGTDKPLYLLNRVIKIDAPIVMVTEGQIDALTAWQYGFPCCATMGTPSEQQIKSLVKSGVRTIVLAFDNDESGRKFTEKVKKMLPDSVLTYEMVFPQNKKDINDLTKEEFDSGLTKIGISYRIKEKFIL